ncbi:hypothetical protein ACFFK0_17510 [Paenibacillus chartarius]|uniref:Uncharacterized protein n=1 Tax=Paenibacillus chartarius TaxID=747481 RepID=A0ABV6DNK8_9BACL
MLRKLRTDRQFEQAFLAHSSIYVRRRMDYTSSRIGAVEGFNPLYVTVGGERLMRDEYDFLKADT